MKLKPVLAGFTGRKAVYDVEAFPNFVLFAFQDAESGAVTRFVIDDTVDQRDDLRNHVRSLDVLIGYNSSGYDNHVLDAAINGIKDPKNHRVRRIGDCRAIWQVGNDIITDKPWVTDPQLDHGERLDGYPLSIDLAGVLKQNGGYPALKELGVRLGYPVLQDLPIEPGTVLTADQKQDITNYNEHDLALTRLVLQQLDDRVDMRRQLGNLYDLNLTSLSDAKLGETIVISQYEREYNRRLDQATASDDGEPELQRVRKPAHGTQWQCSGADILTPRHSFTGAETHALHARMVQQVFTWTKTLTTEGKMTLAAGHKEIAKIINVGGRSYKFGLGGLHSQDEAIVAASDDQFVLVEYDVASFYPALIMMLRLAPRHLDPDIYLGVFDLLRQQRLEAKRCGNTVVSAGLKIAINAVYGKQSDANSRMLDPRNGLAITMNGQFILLRLIERLAEIDGVTVLTANTDGLRVKIPRQQRAEVDRAVQEIADIYEVTFEADEIARYYGKKINDYLCVYASGTIKSRGNVFNETAQKQAQRIIKRAIHESLAHDIPVEQTVRGCTDINMFINHYRSTKDTVVQDAAGNQYQQTNRWYESIESNGPLFSVNTETGKRTKIQGVVAPRVVNNLPEQFPDDINYQYYVQAAEKQIDAILNPRVSAAKTRAKKLDQLDAVERAELAERQTGEEVDLARMTAIAPQVEHYREDYIGLCQVNRYDSMVNVLVRMWRDPGLGLTKPELIWLMDSFDSGIQYFQKPAKRKDILRHIDWIVQNIVPFDKDLLPPDDEPVNVIVNVLRDEPGGGKTRKALKMIVTNGPRIYWWAINKINPLASERQAELMALAEAHGVQVNFRAIHCEANGRGTMIMQVDQRMQEINDYPGKADTIFVTIVTHKTLLDNELTHVSGVLLIDEPIEVWEQRHFNFAKSYRVLRELVEPHELPENYDGDANPGVEANTQAVRLVLTQQGWEVYHDQMMASDTVHSSYHWIIRQAGKTNGRIYAMVDELNNLDKPGGGDLDVLALLHPRHIANFDETWMMAAHFDQLIVYELWTALYDVTWNFVDLDDGWQRKTPLSERVTLYYLLENRQISAAYLESAKHCRAMADAVSEFYGDAPYIWSTSQAAYEAGYFAKLRHEVDGADGHTHNAYLTPKANGINCYQTVHAAAWLGTIKLPSSLLSMLRRLWPGGDARRMTLINYELYSCLQFLARANSRQFDSSDQVRYIVADKEQADYVARMWSLPPDHVVPLPMRPELKAALDDVAPKVGRKSTMTDDQRRERRRQKEARRRAACAITLGRKPGRNGRPRKVASP